MPGQTLPETSLPETSLPETSPADWPTLIERARCGDDAALSQIVRQTHDYLLAVAESRVGPLVQSKFGASDIVQQSMLEASQRIDTFRGATEAELRGWMKRIVLHNLTDAARRFTSTQSRKVSREVAIDGGEDHDELACQFSPTASWMVLRDEQSQQLLKAVSRLPERQRAVVEQRHRWGRTYLQIAENLNVTENAARNLWTRAMHNLREMLSEADGQLLQSTATAEPAPAGQPIRRPR